MKYIKTGFCIMILLTAFICATLGVSASEYEDIGEEYEQMLDGIPQDIAEMLPDGLFSDDLSEIHGAVEQMSSFEYIINTVVHLFGLRLGDAVRLFASLVGLVVLSALLRSVRSLIRSPVLGSTVGFCSTAALLGAVVMLQYEQLNMISTFLDRLNILAEAMIPIMGVLYAMGGNVAAAAVNNSAMMIFLTVCQTLCNRTVLPVTVLCLCFSLASAFSPAIDMKGIAGFVKKSYTVIISFTMTLLITVLAAQSTLAAASDGLGGRAAKFVAGHFIPVIGGTVGESLKTVAGSIKYIRSTVGVAGIIIIVLLVLPPLISVILTRLSVMLSGTAARLLGCHEEAGLLGEVTNIYGYLLAVICACSVMFIFALTLLAHTSAAIGA